MNTAEQREDMTRDYQESSVEVHLLNEDQDI